MNTTIVQNSGGRWHAWVDDGHTFNTGGHLTESDAREALRNLLFRACPILQDYLATALADLQLGDAEEGEARDSGTVYDCPNDTFERAANDCFAFMAANHQHVEAATELEPGSDGLRYSRGDPMDHDRIGSTFYLSRVGTGVGFTDDGNADCLKALEAYAGEHSTEGLYFGEDGKAYWA